MALNRSPVVRDIEGTLLLYWPALYRVALRKLRNHEDAQDAVQDAVLSAFAHISQFKGHSHISTWLHRIVINAAQMQLRGRHGRVLVSLDQTQDGENPSLKNPVVDSRLNPEEICRQSELRTRVQQSLTCLSPKLRKAVQMRHIDELSTTESARALGITRSSLKSRTQRARLKLGNLLRPPRKA